MKKCLLSLFIIFLLSLSVVFSYTTLTEWGNGEVSTSGCNNWLWTSCYPQSKLDLNFSNDVVISQTSDFQPMLWYNMNDINDPTFTQRYIYVFNGVYLNIYSAYDGSLYSSSVLPGKFISKPDFIRTPINQYYLYGIMNVSNVFKSVLLAMDSNKNVAVTQYTNNVSNKSKF